MQSGFFFHRRHRTAMKATSAVRWASFRSTIKHTILWETAENKDPPKTHPCLHRLLKWMASAYSLSRVEPRFSIRAAGQLFTLFGSRHVHLSFEPHFS